MAKNRMKKTVLVTDYETAKGKCRLYEKGWFKIDKWSVRNNNDVLLHDFLTRSEAMQYIREQLL